MAKYKNTQALLEYFSMLRSYEENGYLEIQGDKYEAFITRAALYSLVPESTREDVDVMTVARSAAAVTRYIAAYRCYRRREVLSREPFALHVVDDDAPHELSFTVVQSRRCVWWKLWLGEDECNDFIFYKDEKA